MRLFGLVYHSQRVAGWTLCIGDVVLKKDQWTKYKIKQTHTWQGPYIVVVADIIRLGVYRSVKIYGDMLPNTWNSISNIFSVTYACT